MWRACERFGVRPPGIKADWDEILPWHQAQLLAFDQIRGVEDAQLALSGRML